MPEFNFENRLLWQSFRQIISFKFASIDYHMACFGRHVTLISALNPQISFLLYVHIYVPNLQGNKHFSVGRNGHLNFTIRLSV